MKSSVHSGSLLLIMSLYLMPLISDWLVEPNLQVQEHFGLSRCPKFSNFPFFWQQNHSTIVLILLPTWKRSETLSELHKTTHSSSLLSPQRIFTLSARTFFPTIVSKDCAYCIQVPFLEIHKVKRRNSLNILLCKSFWHSFHIFVEDENWSVQSRSRTPKRHSDCFWFFYLEVQRAWVSSLKEEKMSYLKK